MLLLPMLLLLLLLLPGHPDGDEPYFHHPTLCVTGTTELALTLYLLLLLLLFWLRESRPPGW
jgi:predicted lipid carrier protein YhbT